jgi:hypothetical protein
MLSMLLAYDAGGNVVGTLDFMVRYDDTKPERPPLGLVDWAEHELAGGSLTDVWVVNNAVGSGSWPEWLGSRAYDFSVELQPGMAPGNYGIRALVHKVSGFRRERAAVQARIAARIAASHGDPADIRDIVGGPDRPLRIDADGRTVVAATGGGPALPVAPIR